MFDLMMLHGLLPARKDVFLVSEDLPRYLSQQDWFYGNRSVRRVVCMLRNRKADEARRKTMASDRWKASEHNSWLKYSVFAFWKIHIPLFLLTFVPCQTPLIIPSGGECSWTQLSGDLRAELTMVFTTLPTAPSSWLILIEMVYSEGQK